MEKINEEAKKFLHQTIEQCHEKGALFTISSNRKLLQKPVGGEKVQFIAQPGHTVDIHIEVPGRTSAFGVTVERLINHQWEKLDWMKMQVGDIVRFRSGDGKIEIDQKITIQGTSYLEIRDWIVRENTFPGGGEGSGAHPCGVRVDPHDFDISDHQFDTPDPLSPVDDD